MFNIVPERDKVFFQINCNSLFVLVVFFQIQTPQHRDQPHPGRPHARLHEPARHDFQHVWADAEGDLCTLTLTVLLPPLPGPQLLWGFMCVHNKAMNGRPWSSPVSPFRRLKVNSPLDERMMGSFWHWPQWTPKTKQRGDISRPKGHLSKIADHLFNWLTLHIQRATSSLALSIPKTFPVTFSEFIHWKMKVNQRVTYFLKLQAHIQRSGAYKKAPVIVRVWDTLW